MSHKRNSSDPSFNLEAFLSSQEQNSFFQQWEQLKGLASEISKRSNQIDELMQALNSLSFAVKDKGALKQIISALAKLNQNQTQKKAKSAPEKSSEKTAPALSDDDFYNLFNSPAMKEIVKEVMKAKRRG